MLVSSICITTKRNKLSMVLLVAVRIEGTLVSNEVKEKIYDVVEYEDGYESSRSAEHVEIRNCVVYKAAKQESKYVIHSQKFDDCVETQIAKIMKLQDLKFLHTSSAVAFIHFWTS